MGMTVPFSVTKNDLMSANAHQGGNKAWAGEMIHDQLVLSIELLLERTSRKQIVA
jgi:hypothetical protein